MQDPVETTPAEPWWLEGLVSALFAEDVSSEAAGEEPELDAAAAAPVEFTTDGDELDVLDGDVTGSADDASDSEFVPPGDAGNTDGLIEDLAAIYAGEPDTIWLASFAGPSGANEQDFSSFSDTGGPELVAFDFTDAIAAGGAVARLAASTAPATYAEGPLASQPIPGPAIRFYVEGPQAGQPIVPPVGGAGAVEGFTTSTGGELALWSGGAGTELFI